MEAGFQIVLDPGTGYYEEKKSRFIADVFPVRSVEEVNERLSEVSKKYYDASHHCYGYVIGGNREIKKCSDDGEPQKTAGAPILSVLEGAGITNALIVVTRYFGGTLLGTGGLVRAYSEAARDGLSNAGLARPIPAELLDIRADYASAEKIRKLFAAEQIPEVFTDYGEDVCFRVPVPAERSAEIQGKITDLSQGKTIVEKLREIRYAVVNGEVRLFEEI